MRLSTRLLLDRLDRLEDRVDQQEQVIAELSALVGDLVRDAEASKAPAWKDGS